jgi:hypothetical protein
MIISANPSTENPVASMFQKIYTKPSQPKLEIPQVCDYKYHKT